MNALLETIADAILDAVEATLEWFGDRARRIRDAVKRWWANRGHKGDDIKPTDIMESLAEAVHLAETEPARRTSKHWPGESAKGVNPILTALHYRWGLEGNKAPADPLALVSEFIREFDPKFQLVPPTPDHPHDASWIWRGGLGPNFVRVFSTPMQGDICVFRFGRSTNARVGIVVGAKVGPAGRGPLVLASVNRRIQVVHLSAPEADGYLRWVG